MGFDAEALALTREGVRSLGSAINLYPVRASEIDAYTGAGLLPTAVHGVIEVRPVLDSSGDVDMQTEAHMLKLDATTAAPIVARHWSLEYAGARYDILRKVPDHPGAIDCYLQEYR